MSTLPLDKIISQFEENNQKMASTQDTKKLIKLSKLHKKLEPQYKLATEIKKLEKAVQANQKLLSELDSKEEEMISLTKNDTQEKSDRIQFLEEELLEFLTPSDPKDEEDIYLEIRAGAGGDESSLFAAEMLEMYSYLAKNVGLKMKAVSFNENSLGGYKEVIAEIRGGDAYSWFKYEGGVHRVQRVPATEKQGRVHTSTVSVAIIPLAEENTDFKLNMDDVEVMVAMASGHGGQSVNTTYSAVHMRHKPTGLEAKASEKNQIQNRETCIKLLTARVFDYYEQIRLAEEGDNRKNQVGQMDRSEKIRTYNFPQDRITDHRYQQSWNNLAELFKGKIQEVIQNIKRIEAQKNIADLN